MKPTYDIQITNLRTNESVWLAGNETGLAHITPPLQGFGDPDVRSSQYVFSGADGGSVDDQFYGVRQIPLDFFMYSPDLEKLRQEMEKAARVIKIRDNLRVQLFTPAGRVYQTIAKLTEPLDPTIEWPHLADYNIRLVAGDHRMYDFTDGAAQSVIVEKREDGGLLWSPTGLLWHSDGLHWEGSSAPPRAVNDGNVHVWPIITLRGTAVNPSITNQTLNETLALNLTMGADDVVVFDTQNREVKFNGQNIENNLSRSQYWRLVPGINDILLNSANNSDTITAKIEWHNAYTGVA